MPKGYMKSLTVGQLRDILAKLPDDLTVVIAKDELGTAFSPCDAWAYGLYAGLGGDAPGMGTFTERTLSGRQYAINKSNAMVLYPSR